MDLVLRSCPKGPSSRTRSGDRRSPLSLSRTKEVLGVLLVYEGGMGADTIPLSSSPCPQLVFPHLLGCLGAQDDVI